MSAQIIQLDVFREKPLDGEPRDIVMALDVAIRDLGEIIEYWGSEGARARAIECERMLKRVFKTAVIPPTA